MGRIARAKQAEVQWSIADGQKSKAGAADEERLLMVARKARPDSKARSADMQSTIDYSKKSTSMRGNATARLEPNDSITTPFPL